MDPRFWTTGYERGLPLKFGEEQEMKQSRKKHGPSFSLSACGGV
jgi:hypothetical protein